MQVITEFDSAKLETGLANSLERIHVVFEEELAEEARDYFIYFNAPNVPFDTGILRMGAVEYFPIYREFGTQLIVEVEYSAHNFSNGNMGFNYAEEQETNEEYSHRFGDAHYIERGLEHHLLL